MKHYACMNCGYWQHFFDVPPFCPVCMDVRNDLPPDGWSFASADEMREREERGEIECVWREIDEDVWMFSNVEPLGIGSSGYLIRRVTGNIAFESPGWWTEKAFEKLDELGGARFISSSHPHGFGALYALQKQFPGATVAFQKDAVKFTKAFAVNLVFDDELLVDEALKLYTVGGHYEGQTVLYHEPRKMLFCGDALKVDLGDGGEPLAISCHKAFHKQIPLSRGEIENYEKVIGNLDFTQICTPFEHAPNATTADALRLFDFQLSNDRTSAAPIALKTDGDF